MSETEATRNDENSVGPNVYLPGMPDISQVDTIARSLFRRRGGLRRVRSAE